MVAWLTSAGEGTKNRYSARPGFHPCSRRQRLSDGLSALFGPSIALISANKELCVAANPLPELVSQAKVRLQRG